MKLQFTFCFLCLQSICLLSQTPSLVVDLNPGMVSGLPEYYETPIGVDLPIGYLLTADNGSTGLEIYLLKNDQLQLVKDIIPGGVGSEPLQYAKDDSIAYFTIKATDGTRQVWKTDGTEAGTVQLPITQKPTLLFVGNDHYLYFQANNFLYSFNPLTNDVRQITTDKVDLQFFQVKTGTRALPYQKGLLFIKQDENAKLYYTYQDTTVVLGQIPDTESFTQGFALCALGKDVIFACSNTFYPDTDGLYYFTYADASFKRISTAIPVRMVPYTDSKTLALIGTGIGIVTKDSIYQVANGLPAYLPQGLPWYTAVSADKAFVLGGLASNFLGSKFMKIKDFTASLVHETDRSFISPLFTQGDSVWYASSAYNYLPTKIWNYNFKTETSTLVHQFTQETQGPNFIPLTVLDGSLYFMSIIDVSKGRELYKLPLTSVATHEISGNHIKILVDKGGFKVIGEGDQGGFNVRLFSPTGALVFTKHVLQNEYVDMRNYHSGFYFICVDNKRDKISKKLWIGN